MAFWANIYPFQADPDKPVRVLFFPVPLSTPFIPYPTPNILRFWDMGDDLEEPTYGLKYERIRYETGPLPANLPGTPCGTEAQWAGDIDYATWLAEGYSCSCPGPILNKYVIDVYSPLGTIDVDPHDGHVLIDVNDAYPFVWIANHTFQAFLQSDTTGLPNFIAFQVLGTLTAGVVAVFEVVNNGLTQVQGAVKINGDPLTAPTALNVLPYTGMKGVVIEGIGTLPLTDDALFIESHGVGVMFRVTSTGQLCTNQTQPAGSGTLVSQMPIYNGAGTLVGYIGIGDTGAPDSGGGGIAIGNPVGGSTAGSVLYVDSSGNLANDLLGNFWYDVGGSGPLAVPNTLYIGGENGNTFGGSLALWDQHPGAWRRIYADAGDFVFGTDLNIHGNLTATGDLICNGATVLIQAGGVLDMEGQTSGPTVGLGVLGNAPHAGPPDFWLPVTVNGTPGWVPWWHA